MFENASRLQLRYKSRVGLIGTEDLWTLPLSSETRASLDEIAITVHEEIEKTGKKSFVKTNRKDKVLELKMDIVKYIIEVKIKEAKDSEKAADNKERKELLMDVIAEKEIDELKGKSVKELQREAKKL